MRKYLIAFLLSLSCACALAATACGEDAGNSTGSVSTPPDSTSSSPIYTGKRTVEFEDGEGFEFVTDVESGSQVDAGSYVDFEIDLGAFYSESNPTVYVNGLPVAHDGEGHYSVQVQNDDLLIRVENVRKDEANLYGTGTMEDPFLVYKPMDLIYIADQVNAGKQSYVQGAYVLMNDIDCKGEELKVIGDLSNENAYFSGCFSCYIDENGVRTRNTISNFKINSQNANYVGLFGSVQADFTVESSGLIYGIRLDNFTIEAGISQNQGESDMLCVGSLIGYGAGANVLLCEATNGEIYLSGNASNFSFAGGLIGYQQAFYYAEYDQYFSSEVSFANVDVDIMVQSGVTMYAGGITGYLATNYPLISIPSIHNSYATGDVSGALRSGGIAGGLGQYSVVSNCYATGNIYAECLTKQFAASDEYYMASAGGLVGFAENDSIVHDSVFLGTAEAYAAKGDAYTFKGAYVGNGYDAKYVSSTSQKYIVLNCLSEADLSDKNFFTEKLGWGDYDWKFAANELPTINDEDLSTQVTKSMTIKYVAPSLSGEDKSVKVDGASSFKRNYFDTSIESANMYTSIGSFFAGNGLKNYYTADNGYVSYGYFFDEACTQRVPYSYFPLKDITLYVAFSDLTPVVGTYYVQGSAESGVIELRADGIMRYTDGAYTQEAYYAFDGEYITVDGARLARYYDGPVTENANNSYFDANFDPYRYEYYNFAGYLEDGVLKLYDGYYFTEDAPLTASTTAPIPSALDEYAGTWTMTANLPYSYIIDGNGGISLVEKTSNNLNDYTVLSKVAYTAEEGGISFTIDGVAYFASFNSDGFLEVVGNHNTETYYRENSFVGSWTNDDLTLTLNGIQKNGTGLASVTYSDGTVYDLVYEHTLTEGYVALYFPHDDYWKDALFGYFSYDGRNHQLSVVLTDASTETGFSAYTLSTLDDLYGDWITSVSGLEGVEISFNGKGLYDDQGKVTLANGNDSATVSYSLNSKQEGSFVYNGVEYAIAYDPYSGNVVINATGEMFRKDVLAGKTFVDGDGNEYVFDGKSPLGKATFTINGELSSYTYGAGANTSDFVIYDGSEAIGSLTVENNHYKYSLNGAELYIQNEFMGVWAMNGLFSTFTVGATDLDGVIQGHYLGKSIELTEYDNRILTFDYNEQDGQPHTYYVFILDDDTAIGGKTLVLTEYASIVGDDQIVCTKTSDLHGTFKNATSSMTLTFDGVKSSYAYGVAKQAFMGNETLYNYVIKDTGVIMWSQEVLSGKIYYYSLKLTDLTAMPDAASNPNAWIDESTGKVVIREETDSLYLTELTDKDGNEYLFAAKGELHVNGELKYTYKTEDVSYNNSKGTIDIIVTDVETNVSYKCVISQSEYVITFGEEV